MDPGFDIGALHICVPGSDISLRARDDKLRTMFKKITGHMIAGRAAVIVGLGNDPIPDELQPLCAPPLRLPPPDRPMLLALFALYYGKEQELMPVEALPSDASLAEIPPLVIATALRAESPAAALEALRKIITVRPDTSELRDGVIRLDEVAGQVALILDQSTCVGDWVTAELRHSFRPKGALRKPNAFGEIGEKACEETSIDLREPDSAQSVRPHSHGRQAGGHVESISARFFGCSEFVVAVCPKSFLLLIRKWKRFLPCPHSPFCSRNVRPAG
ncbi:MAG: hypothetical protein ACU0CT_15325 [Paracoccaceae bacterium]